MAKRGNVSYPALRDLSVFTNRTLTWYPFPSPQVQRRSIISSIYDNNGTTPAMQRMFGRIRAGAKARPWPNSICPACNNADGGTMRILSSCESSARCRSLLLQNLLGDIRSTYCTLTNKNFVKAISNVERMTRQVRKEAIKFVWNAIEAARQRALSRRDSV